MTNANTNVVEKQTPYTKIKDYLGNVTTILTGLGIIIGGWLIIDERYAHAQVVKQMQSEQAQQIKQLRIESTRKFYQSRIEDLEQKKFEVEVKPHKTQQDFAFIQRYDKKIESLSKQAAEEQRSIEQ